MTISLDRLPFDLLFCVVSYLALEDIVHIGQTCKQLRALLDERTVCRSTVEVSTAVKLSLLTQEADVADRSTIIIPKRQA